MSTNDLNETMVGFFNGSQPIEEAISALNEIIKVVKRFYNFRSIIMKVRQIQFLLCEFRSDPWAIKKAQDSFNKLKDLILSMKVSEKKGSILSSLVSLCEFDYTSHTMQYYWREQHSFEENFFYSDSNLFTQVNDQIQELVNKDSHFSNLESLINGCVDYLADTYKLDGEKFQLSSFMSRTIYGYYHTINAKSEPPAEEREFLDQISLLRNKAPSRFLSLKEKFMPLGSLEVSCISYPGLYQNTVKEANALAFLYIPDDIIRTVCTIHEILFEEMARVAYSKEIEKRPLAEFRGKIEIGSDDFMPILQLVLVLTDIPNMPDIIRFLEEYSTQCPNNYKSGLFICNIVTAYQNIIGHKE